MHDLSLISTIAAAFASAWLCGLVTQRLGLSPIVGYLIGGVLIGPHTPGFIGDIHIAQQLAEVGVILLMFGVGLHFHLKDLLAVKSIAIPGAVVQSAVATIAAVILFTSLGFPVKTSAILGMAMAVASTVVLMRVLMDADVLNSAQGHVAVGWLIVEDVFTVVLLVLIPMLGTGMVGEHAASQAAHAASGGGSFWTTLGLALLKLLALVAIVLFAGSRIIPWVLVQVARLRSRELFTLTVLVFSIAIAAGSYFFFGASMALGAFLAGMVVAQSPVSHQAAADALPMRDAFAVVFFVSVGMLFDPMFIVREPLLTLAGLSIILIAKPLAALLIVALLGRSARTGLTVAIGLAQIGEFSFIVSELARHHGLMSADGHNLLVAGAIISITLNPLLFRSLPQIEKWLRSRPALWSLLNRRAEKLSDRANLAAKDAIRERDGAGERLAVVVGYGPVGRSVDRLLRDARLATVIVDMNMDTVAALNSSGRTAIFGDASREGILEAAGVKRASHVVLTLPHSTDRAAVVAAAREMNPSARILVRARYLREREDLEHAGATAAVFEEAEAAVGLARLVLSDTGVHREAAERKVRDLRLQMILENVSNIRAQRVRRVMVPWMRVRRLSSAAGLDDVRMQVTQARYSRWPVIDPSTGRAVGYLLAKDLISQTATTDWRLLLRPLRAIAPDDDLESTLARMQSEDATLYLVEDAGVPVGLITLEDIIEQVVGRIEDEYRHEGEEVSLAAALRAGAAVFDLAAASRDQAIRELSAAIPPHRLPAGRTTEEIATLALAREAEVSTDLGVGVAIPHARCPELTGPIVVLGHSREGIMFSPQSPELVRLVFLLVTPTDRPEMQLTLLGELAAVAGNAEARAAMQRAVSADEVAEIIEHGSRSRNATAQGAI